MKKKDITPELLERIITHYLSVKSAKVTANEFGLNVSSLYYLLKANKVDTTIDKKKAGEMIRKYEFDHFYFSEIDTRDKAYITGILHSDGCITRGTRQVRIKLTDIDLLEKINSKIYKDRKLYISVPKNPKHKTNGLMVITHDQIYEDVQKHGCCLDKTYNLKFPTTIPDELMGDYFRGFFDGDGCIYVSEKLSYKPATVRIVATKTWVLGAIEWLNKIGIRVTEYWDKRHDNRITTFSLKDVKSIELFYNLMYKDLEDQIYLERKYNKYKENIEFRQSLNINNKFDSSEEFFPVPGFPNIAISKNGNVKNTTDSHGNLVSKDKGLPIAKTAKFRLTVPQLLAMTFIGDRPSEDSVVIHINGDKLDNNLSNLKWGSMSEAIQNSFKHGNSKNIGEQCNFAKINKETVLHIRSLVETGIDVKKISEMLGIEIGTIYNVATGKTWKHVEGFILPRKQNKKKITLEMKNEIIALFKQGIPQHNLSKRFDIHQSIISRLLKTCQ